MELWQRWLREEELDTPLVAVHRGILQQNVEEMASFARKWRVRLRPHLKTHKTVEIAQMQLSAGAVGLTCAKLGEAEVFLNAGFRDILIAYPLVGAKKIGRLFDLMERYPDANLETLTDSAEHAAELAAEAVRHGRTVPLWVKVDSGLGRVGVQPGVPAASLTRALLTMPGVRVRGLLTHAGHAYGAADREAVREIGEWEARCLLETKEQAALPIELEISVGSTPTVRISGQVPGVTEIRPGNYVFCDATQVRLGAATLERCALRVLARVVSRPTPERLVIDAGAKTLALDRGAHGSDALLGYGVIVGHPHAVIERLSEEHGVVRVPKDCSLRASDVVEIVPNHSCPVVNLTDELLVLDESGFVGMWSVLARGKTQ
jgi:D-serine deaminase-like pyridoxal phosphate-dependent protein